MKNIEGVFKIKIKGKELTMKANFSVIEKLETTVWENSSITKKFFEAFQGNVKLNTMADVFYLGLCAANDTRLSRDEIGQALIEGGGVNEYLPVYVRFLQYFIDGGKEASPANPL